MNSNPTRILHVIGTMDRAGAETMLMNIYRALDRERFQFDFLIHDRQTCDYEAEIEALGGRLYRLPFRFNGINGIQYRRRCREFFQAHPEHPIVHGHIGSSAALYLDEARIAKRVTIAHSHAQRFPFSLGRLGFSFFSYFTRFVAQWFLAVSSEAGRDRFGKTVVESDRFFIVPCGIDVKTFASNDADHRKRKQAFLARGGFDAAGNEAHLSYSADNPPLILGTVGRLTAVKNQELLLSLTARLRLLGLEVLTVLVGAGDKEHSLRQIAQSLGIADCCLFFGATDSVADILKVMDVCVIPSYKEGFCIAALEAQTAGVPTVLSTGVPASVTIADQTQRIPVEADLNLWAEAVIDSYLQAPRRSLGAEALKACGYTNDAIARWMEAFYGSIQEGVVQ